MSKSATKAFRGEIGREQKPGISAFLFVCPGSIGAFATDLDKRRRRGPPGRGRRPSDGDHDGHPDDQAGP